ncbi:MAG: thiamine phosphate synthase, partial [Sulfurimonas sp.]
MQLYGLCDQDLLDSKALSLERFVELCIKKDAKVIQYRNKSGDLNYIKSSLIKLRKLYDGFLIINDYYELVELCDGVHLGQDDLLDIDKDGQKAISSLKSYIGKDKLIGLSTHNKDEILKANSLELNYIGLGAYRA